MDPFTQAELDEIQNDPEAEVDHNSPANTALPSFPQSLLPPFQPLAGVQTPLSNSAPVRKRRRSAEGQAGNLRGPRVSNYGQSPNESKRLRKNPPSSFRPVPSTYVDSATLTPTLSVGSMTQSHSTSTEKHTRCEYLLELETFNAFCMGEVPDITLFVSASKHHYHNSPLALQGE